MPSCIQCKTMLKQTWNYCPGCGEIAHERKNDLLEALFSELYIRLEKEGIILKKEKTLPKEHMQKYQEELNLPTLMKKREDTMLTTQNQMQLFKEIVEDPEIKVRRLSDTIVYTLKMPGLTRKKDVSINQMENTVEVKVYTKDKVYYKALQISLPLVSYLVKQNQLIIKFRPMGE